MKYQRANRANGRALAIGLAICAWPVAALAGVPSQGSAWPQLEKQVDALVGTVIEKKNLPGMTVAVTKDGRLVLSKGYGLADIRTGEKMGAETRGRIGSVTKAVATGPAGFQVLESKGIDPKTKKLYGLDGVFALAACGRTQ